MKGSLHWPVPLLLHFRFSHCFCFHSVPSDWIVCLSICLGEGAVLVHPTCALHGFCKEHRRGIRARVGAPPTVGMMPTRTTKMAGVARRLAVAMSRRSFGKRTGKSCRPKNRAVAREGEVVELLGNGPRYGCGFSAGGLLFPYYIGVLDELRTLGYVDENTPVAGSSAGALIAAVNASGLGTEEVFLACKELVRDCRVGGTRYRLREVLRRFLDELLPDDIHIRASGKTYVGITQITPVIRSSLVNTFESKEDLISALLTSSHVPLFMERSIVTNFRGKVCVDGGFTKFLPVPPVEDLRLIRICCFPASQLGRIVRGAEISPDSFKEAPYDVKQLLTWALSPAEDMILEELFQLGKEDTRLWANFESMSLSMEDSREECL